MDGGGLDKSDAMPLFRPESLEAARDRMGSPVRAVGIASWVLSAFLALLLIIAGIFLGTAQYARHESIVGILQPTAGALRVSSLRPGIISTVEVREGQSVARGQALMTLTMDPTVSDGRRLGDILSTASDQQGAALARQAIARRDLIAQQREELAAKRTALLDQQRRLTADAALQEERVRLADQTAQAARTLWDKQLMSAIQYRQREEALIVARQGLSAIEREGEAIPSALAQLAAADRRLLAEAEDSSAAIAASEALLSEKRASTEAETKIVLTAQKAGQIAALQAKPGGAVQAGQALAFVLPQGVSLQAELWAPSRAAGFVSPGDRVRLMYDAFPYQRFGVAKGRVVEVARAPIAPADLPVPIRTEESLYRVLVALDEQDVHGYGQNWHLAPGMRLTADVVLEKQSLLAWLFDRVRAAQIRATSL
jgi:membrane fusion protein